MIKPRKRLVDATVAALYLAEYHGIIVAASTIRTWAARGKLTRYGDGRTGAHFDLNEIDRIGRSLTAGGGVAADPDQ